jgi:ferredoxin-NADP reductase
VEGRALLERLVTRRVPVTWRVATVAELRPETSHATTLVLEVPEWPGHLAGQHVDVRLTAEDGYQAERSYSIASAPEDPKLAVTVERIDDGEVSLYLTDEVRPGDQFELRGPIGGYFTWQVADGGPLVLLAGGSGLIPLMAMLRHRANAGSTVEAHILVSAREWSDVLYRDELDRHGQDGVDVRYTLTRRQPDGWIGGLGRVDAEMLRQVEADAGRQPRLYVCGPTGFVEHVAELLVALGHDPHAIKTERFGPTGG